MEFPLAMLRNSGGDFCHFRLQSRGGSQQIGIFGPVSPIMRDVMLWRLVQATSEPPVIDENLVKDVFFFNKSFRYLNVFGLYFFISTGANPGFRPTDKNPTNFLR